MARGSLQDRGRSESEDQDDEITSPPKRPSLSLFQFSTPCEKTWIAVAIILAILSGIMPCVISVLYGEFCNLMIDRQFPTDAPSTETVLLAWFGGGRILQNASRRERQEALKEDSRAWGIGCAVFTLIQFLFSILSVFLLCYMAYRQVSRVKVILFKSVLCKDLAWFETRMIGNFAVQTSDDLNKLEAATGSALGILVCVLMTITTTVVTSFLYGWKLTLVIVFSIPISLGISSTIAKFQTGYVAEEMKLYSKAGSVAEEVFTSIRTVVAFGGENKEIERYSNLIKESKKYGVKRGLVTGISNAVSWFIIYGSYSVAFFYGVRLLELANNDDDFDFTPGDLLIVLFGILTALTNVGFATTHLETLSVARGAMLSVFEIISTESKINPCSEDGHPGADCKGEIEFRNVHFEYPSRKGVRILNGVNLKIKAGEVVAIVGGSGAGKSTILQLVQRLYDPSKGEVLLDGRDIKFLKVSWLRQQLGVVGQEPLLFSTTIRDNILYGNMEASDEAVQKAAAEANAHNFIQKLKDGYNTVIGQKGSTLSGGQKQRIAIARALIRDPKILLLDEATSALDATSEAAVQAALDRAAIGRTTLIVTHRLSTIAKVDRIIVLADGVVREEGTHQQLVAANGLYKHLLQSQEENLKEKEKPPVELTVPTPRVVYEDPTFLPPGPRSRISSVGSSKGPKGQVIESRNMFKNATCYDLVKWSNPEWFYICVGFLASLLGGAALPAVCVLFGDLFGLLSLTDFNEIISKTDFYALILICVGMGAAICVFLQVYCFAIAGMRLTCRLRIKAFTRIIRQEIGYFDKEKNKVGALCVRLSKDPSEIQATVGIRLGVLIQSLATMGIGITLSFFFNWKMTLVATATLPLVFAGVYIESLFAESTETESGENATKIAVEVIANIKAVASLGKESFFVEKYSAALWKEKKKNIRKAWLRGFAFAIGQTAPFFCYALTLWYGGVLVADENVHYKYVIIISELLIFGAWTVGQSVAVGPSFGQTKLAMNRLQYIFSKKTKVKGGNSTFPPDLRETGGIIRYSGVDFFYPTRPGVQALRNLSMNIRPGQSVAVVGPSGSGKSTVIQLLQRFYDPTFGYISANDVDIREYTLTSLRKELGLVSQEPVLFNRTIEENIAYGDNTREVPLAEIITAAKSANIHSFIASLPLGYGTNVGGQGTHLSGGQKQRIAISRALVRNPQILLLDEATSALDPQSESIVQDALDKASSGRTTITVAHRLSAVRNADLIYVIESGKVKEYGTHEELMKLKGLYYDMHHQTLAQVDDDENVEEVKENKPETSEK